MKCPPKLTYSKFGRNKFFFCTVLDFWLGHVTAVWRESVSNIKLYLAYFLCYEENKKLYGDVPSLLSFHGIFQPVLLIADECLTEFVQWLDIAAHVWVFLCLFSLNTLLQDLKPLSDLFSPGMLVRCAVASLEKTAAGHPSIQLTINPKEVNKALNTMALKPGMVWIILVPYVYLRYVYAAFPE